MQVNNNNNVSFGAIKIFPELDHYPKSAYNWISEIKGRFNPKDNGGILFFKSASEQDLFSRELGTIPHVATDYFEDGRDQFHIWRTLNALTMHFKK